MKMEAHCNLCFMLCTRKVEHLCNWIYAVILMLLQWFLILYCGAIYWSREWHRYTGVLPLAKGGALHKPLWSFSFWLLMTSYAYFNDVLSLCMIMAVIDLLVSRSQSFASPHFILSMSSTRASNSQKPSYANVSTINSYEWYLQAIPSKFSCATFQKTVKILLVLWHYFQLMGT
jgi:hypothetical protein